MGSLLPSEPSDHSPLMKSLTSEYIVASLLVSMCRLASARRMRGIVDTPDDDPRPLAVARQRRLQQWRSAATGCSKSTAAEIPQQEYRSRNTTTAPGGYG